MHRISAERSPHTWFKIRYPVLKWGIHATYGLGGSHHGFCRPVAGLGCGSARPFAKASDRRILSARGLALAVAAVGGGVRGGTASAQGPLIRLNSSCLEHHPAGFATPSAQATANGAVSISGTWDGSYTCSQGQTGLRLVITSASGGMLTAVFNFYAIPSNPDVPSGSYAMTGTYSAAGVTLTQEYWIY